MSQIHIKNDALCFIPYWKRADLSAVMGFWSVLHGGNMKGDFFYFEGMGWLASRGANMTEGWAVGRREGRRYRFMFHPLFLPRYLDYVPTH